MAHHHNHDHGQAGSGSVSNLAWAFALNTFFALVELVGGYLTNSVSIASDALHDFGDSLSLGLSLYFHKKSNRKSDLRYTYGYRRFSLIGAFVNSIVLIAGSVFVIKEAVERIMHPVQPDANGMVWLALLGILVNGAAMFRLRKGHSVNERVISLHFIEDLLGWIAVLAGALVMRFYDVPVLDPILSLLIACYILYNVYGNIKATIGIVLQGFPESIDRQKVMQVFESAGEIRSVHDLHVWSLDGNFHVLSAHVVLHKDAMLAEVEPLKQKLKHAMEGEGIDHCTLEFELEGAHCHPCEMDEAVH